MELNIFMKELQSALVVRGIPDETAAKHVSNLRRTFTSDDLSEIDAIQSKNEIDQLADSIAVILKKNKKQPESKRPPQQVETVAEVKSELRPAPPPKEIIVSPSDYREKKHEQSRQKQSDDPYFEYSPEHEPSTKGMLIFWVGLFVTLPITLSLAAVLFGAFAAVFIGLGALIVAGIVCVIAVVAAGAGASLVGIIFGITQLFSFLAAGIYEIGLGIMVAGAVLFVSVLIYNLSIRFLPWVITLVGNLLGYTCGKLKDLFLYVRRECYKL